MFAKSRPHLSYSNVTATLALFLALGTGGAYAADTIGSGDVIDESLLSVDIKNAEVKNADVASNAITSTKIFNGSVINSELGASAVTSDKVLDNALTGSDINESTLSGVRLTGLVRKHGAQVPVPAGQQRFARVACDAGQVLLNGGVATTSTSTAVSINSAYPTDYYEGHGSVGYGGVINNASAQPTTAIAWATCAPGDVPPDPE